MSEDVGKAGITATDAHDYSSYLAGWKQRQQREKAVTEQRRTHARQVAAKAVEILKQHGATKVILFGSVLEHTFKQNPDIDRAVEMPPAAWWEWYLRLGEALEFSKFFSFLRAASEQLE
ncbi:nucleotidyltransferase domain-containing protein [candidate division KSB1 bacterium]|nr:nucleotidyltransferase domain-containing protein [candidate division KSB1 bacterium]